MRGLHPLMIVVRFPGLCLKLSSVLLATLSPRPCPVSHHFFSTKGLHWSLKLDPHTFPKIYMYIYIYISRKAKQIPESTILVGRDLSRRSGRSLPTASQPKTSLGAGSRVQCSPMFRVQQSECGLAGLESSSKKRFYEGWVMSAF